MDSLKLLTCNPKQSRQLVELGVIPWGLLWHCLVVVDKVQRWDTGLFRNPEPSDEMVPAWTMAELNAMVGPRFAKPDLWNPERLRDKSATDPNTYPIFTPERVTVFNNGAEAAAHGLIYLLENLFIGVDECNERYMAVFQNKRPYLINR